MSEQQGPMICNNTKYYAHIKRDLNNGDHNFENKNTIKSRECKTVPVPIEGYIAKGYNISMTTPNGEYAGEISPNCSSDTGKFNNLTISQIGEGDNTIFVCKSGIKTQTKKKIAAQVQVQIQAQVNQPVSNNCTKALKKLVLILDPSASARICKNINK